MFDKHKYHHLMNTLLLRNIINNDQSMYKGLYREIRNKICKDPNTVIGSETSTIIDTSGLDFIKNGYFLRIVNIENEVIIIASKIQENIYEYPKVIGTMKLDQQENIINLIDKKIKLLLPYITTKPIKEIVEYKFTEYRLPLAKDNRESRYSGLRIIDVNLKVKNKFKRLDGVQFQNQEESYTLYGGTGITPLESVTNITNILISMDNQPGFAFIISEPHALILDFMGSFPASKSFDVSEIKRISKEIDEANEPSDYSCCSISLLNNISSNLACLNLNNITNSQYKYKHVIALTEWVDCFFTFFKKAEYMMPEQLGYLKYNLAKNMTDNINKAINTKNLDQLVDEDIIYLLKQLLTSSNFYYIILALHHIRLLSTINFNIPKN